MVIQSNFIARMSGRRASSYYIDYAGAYKANDIAMITGIAIAALKDIYVKNGAVYDDSQEVYYFDSLDAARKAISEMFGKVKAGQKGREIVLTEAEVEYIRKALINEGSNSIHISNKVKDEIFKKLNG